MLISRTNPVGIDKPISSLQSKMYDALIQKWSGPYTCTPRCYRNQSAANDYIAEIFTGRDYKEGYFDDTVAAKSFFGINGENQVAEDSVETANVHLVFFVNLNSIKPPGTERRDQEAILDVQEFLETVGRNQGFLLQKVGTGLSYCLKEYPGSRQSEGLKFRDQHPRFCFRFDMAVYYSPTLIDCP